MRPLSPAERDARIEALRLACIGTDGHDPASVVSRAEAFAKFLEGEEIAPKAPCSD